MLAFLAFLGVLHPSCASVARARYLMGTVCEIQADDSAAISAAFDDISAWDEAMSLYKPQSELSRLNAAAGARVVPVSPRLWMAVAAALDAARASGGAFDPTILPVLRSGPEALALVGYRRVRLDAAKRTVRFERAGMALDLGGIGKGIALDSAAGALRARGLRRALLNFGGQILAVGAPRDAAGWRVVVPGRAESFVLKGASMSTSGNEERPGHIASPFTGRRLAANPTVTVIAPTATQADAWSTALFVLGPGAAVPRDLCAVFEGRQELPASCRRYVAGATGGLAR